MGGALPPFMLILCVLVRRAVLYSGRDSVIPRNNTMVPRPYPSILASILILFEFLVRRSTWPALTE